MSSPLADQIRPLDLNDVVGQSHLIGEGKLLTKIVESGYLPNMIFYGPSGVGKTTVARIIAGKTHKKLFKLNGTSASTADIREIIEQVDTFGGYQGIVLYLDEIQYLNKKQQQSLLEHIENGTITLIASTTENPYFYIYNAILSRSTVFEFKPVQTEEVEKVIERAFEMMQRQLHVTLTVEQDVKHYIAKHCGGDVRKSLNTVELCCLAGEPVSPEERKITMEIAKQLSQKSNIRHDRDGDEHYDCISALQKSIRGSDENAALHYLARLLEAGDLLSPCRRLLVVASEDIGLAYPQAISIVKACVDSALQLGLPEAMIPLAQAVVLLATAPKSNSSYLGIHRAIEDVRNGKGNGFPRCLQNRHFDSAEKEVKGQFYQYAHDFSNHYVQQQYFPDDLVGTVYYEYGLNKNEQAAKTYWEKIKGKSSN